MKKFLPFLLLCWAINLFASSPSWQQVTGIVQNVASTNPLSPNQITKAGGVLYNSDGTIGGTTNTLFATGALTPTNLFATYYWNPSLVYTESDLVVETGGYYNNFGGYVVQDYNWGGWVAITNLATDLPNSLMGAFNSAGGDATGEYDGSGYGSGTMFLNYGTVNAVNSDFATNAVVRGAILIRADGTQKYYDPSPSALLSAVADATAGGETIRLGKALYTGGVSTSRPLSIRGDGRGTYDPISNTFNGGTLLNGGITMNLGYSNSIISDLGIIVTTTTQRGFLCNGFSGNNVINSKFENVGVAQQCSSNALEVSYFGGIGIVINNFYGAMATGHGLILKDTQNFDVRHVYLYNYGTNFESFLIKSGNGSTIAQNMTANGIVDDITIVNDKTSINNVGVLVQSFGTGGGATAETVVSNVVISHVIDNTAGTGNMISLEADDSSAVITNIVVRDVTLIAPNYNGGNGINIAWNYGNTATNCGNTHFSDVNFIVPSTANSRAINDIPTTNWPANSIFYSNIHVKANNSAYECTYNGVNGDFQFFGSIGTSAYTYPGAYVIRHGLNVDLIFITNAALGGYTLMTNNYVYAGNVSSTNFSGNGPGLTGIPPAGLATTNFTGGIVIGVANGYAHVVNGVIISTNSTP